MVVSNCILSTDKRVSVGFKISGVRLKYDKIRGVTMKDATVKLLILDLNIDFDDVVKPTGVNMHAHEVARHEIVLPMDQNGSFLGNGKVAHLGQHRVYQVGGLTKHTAGDVPDK